MIRSIEVLLGNVALVFLATGCASAAQQEHAIEAVTTFVSVADPIMHAGYEASLRACLADEKCKDEVGRKWAPIIDAFEVVREAWCDAVPDAKGCKP